MLKRFRAHEENFLTFFKEAAEQLSQAAEQFQLMLGDLANAAQYAQCIDQIEQQSDKITQAAFTLLHKTFITPFDRQHIHQLTSVLDDLIDHINHSARHLVAYQLMNASPELIKLGALGSECAQLIKLITAQLGTLKNIDAILNSCHKIGDLEDEAQDIALAGITRLFSEKGDIYALLKNKEVYERSTLFMEKCQHLANIAKTIVLEYS